MRVESGTCNVCSAPCSSCMHSNRTLLNMESKIVCGSSNNSCAVKEADGCSFICADGMPLNKSRICDDLQPAASEVSNLLSTSSSHDSYSENAESKATVRTSATCEASEDINMPPFLPLRETVEYQFLQEKSLFYLDSHITSDFCHRISSKRDEDQQGLGFHGDNISCITGVKDSNIMLGHHNIDLDNKNATCSSASTDILLSRGVENTVQGEAIDCVHASGNEKRQGNYWRQVTCPEESFLQKKCADSANTAFPDKPDLAEVHLPNRSGSPKVQCPCFPSHNGNAICHNGDCEVSVGSVSFQPHIDGEASSGPQIAVDNKLDENKPPANNGNSKASYTGTHAVKITDPCLENENGSDKGISFDEVKNSGIINTELKIPSSLVEASDMQEPQLVMEGGNSDSEPELTDVKVCDICGDAGREELLAFCCKCSDGAEHIYCMRVMLRKVPEGDWLCEECQLKEDAERKKMDRPEKLSGTVTQCKSKEDDEVRKVDRSEKVSGKEKECKLKEEDEVKKMDRYEKVSGLSKECKLKVHAEVKKGEISEAVSRAAKECKQKGTENKEVDKPETIPGTSKLTRLTETSQKLASKSNSKLMPKFDVKVIDPEVRRMAKGLQSPIISAKRHADSQDVTSSSSKKPAEISGECVETGSPRKKRALSRDSLFKNLDTEKTRVVNMPPSNGSQDVTSSNSKKPAEISGESVETGSPRNIPALLCDSSFNNLDTGKTRVVNMTSSNGSQSANSSKGFSRSQSMLGSHVSKVQAQLQPPHGFLSRSSSFNNANLKPKVKQLTQNVLVKPKITRGSSLNDTRKVAVVRSITKSASFKNIGSGRSNTESASKTQFIHQPHVEKPRSLKQVKERTMMEKKISSTLDRPPTCLSPRSGTGTPLPKMNMKIALHDVKLNNMSESNIPRINKGSDDANGLGRNDAKMQSINSAKTVSASLSASSSEDQRPCQTPEEGARGCSSSTEKLYNNAETVQHRGVFQTFESTHLDDKTKDPTVFSSPRQAVSGGNRILRGQRYNETGHATQFCSVNKLRSSALEPSSDNNSKDGNKKGNKWKAAVETTILKSRLQKNNGQSDQLEEFPASSANPSSEVASKDFLPSPSNHPRNIPLVVGTDGQEEILRSSDVDPIKTSHITDVGQLPSVEDSSTSRAQTIEASCTPKPSKLNATDSVSDELNKNHLRHMLPDQALELAHPCRTSAIPELEFIWQGSLEVLTTGNEPAPFDGIQAHLSTSASPKILEVASKLPCKLRLEEVSWISSWPLQFQGINPDEHNIALFFFAKDVESYERSYSKLLEKMLKNDLALRGHNNGVELLIFPSTKLPVHSQRWNRLFFLWGIFKGRRTDNLTPKPSSHKQPSGGRILNIDMETQDLPCALSSVVFDSQRPLSAENPEARSPRSDISPKPEALISNTWVEMRATSSPKVEERMCRVQNSPVVHSSSFQSAAYSRLPSQQSSQSLPESHFLNSTNQLSNLHSALHPEPRFQMTNTPPCSEVKSDDAYLKNLDFGGTHVVTTSAHIPEIIKLIGLHRASPSLSTSSDCRKDQRTGRESSMKGPGEEEISMKNEAVFYDDPQGDLTWIDCLSREKSNRKRARSCSTEAVSKASDETTKSTGETMLWKDEVNYLPVSLATDGERERKKNCFDEVNASNNFREETSSAWKSSKVHPLFGSFLSEQHSESRDGNSEVVVPDDTRSQAERFFFPVQPSPVQNTQSDKLIHILSSDDEDDSESNSPDLELALGGKQRARKKRQRKDHAEDDISASLSLSLAIPTPKAEWQKPILKSEQHLPDRPDVNTALLLFGGFTDT